MHRVYVNRRRGLYRRRRAVIPRFLKLACPAIALVDLGASTAKALTSSGNWSGYFASAPSNEAFANIEGTFTVPTVQYVAQSSNANEEVGAWVGFDGWNDTTVEQCGIAAAVESNGQTSYFSWYELYPAEPVVLSTNISPGEKLSAEVQYLGESGGAFNFEFTVGGVSAEANTTTDVLSRDTAEWVAEAPGSPTVTLPSYGIVTFSGDEAAANSGGAYDSGTDTNEAISGYGNMGIEMQQSNEVVSLPSSLYSSGESFNINYISTSASLFWSNSTGVTPDDGKTWDVQNNNNWNNGSVATVYSNGDSVTFNDANNGDYNVTISTTVSPGSVTVKNSSGNYVFSGSGGIAGGAALSKSGSDTLTLDTANSFTGGVTVSAGTLVTGVSGALPDGAVKIAGGTLRLGTNTGNPTVSSLSISSGEMDIGNNTLFITYGSSDPISTIAGYVKTGYNSGNWNGTGIISSGARTTTNGLEYGVGWADGKDNVVSGLNSGTIELKYTLLGDANLDGTVNGSDFSIMAANFGTGATNWDQGNFLYTSSVNGTDFSALAANFGAGTSGADGEVTESDVAALDAFAAANGLEADVPEPGSGVAILAGAAVLGRRKRVR